MSRIYFSSLNIFVLLIKQIYVSGLIIKATDLNILNIVRKKYIWNGRLTVQIKRHVEKLNLFVFQGFS